MSAIPPEDPRNIFQGQNPQDQADVEDEVVRELWTLRPLERAFWEGLPYKDKSRFKVFASTFKCEKYNRGPRPEVPSSRATIEEWTLVTDKQKDTWVKKGLEGTANPYTVLINHHLSAVQDILSTREDHRQKQLFFLGHAMYRRMRYVHEIVDDGAPEDNPTNPQQNRDYITAALREGMFKRAWRKEVEKEDRGYISEIVQWTSDRFKEVPIKNYVPGVSGPGKHTYLGNHRSGAAPTMIDEVHIAAQWQRFGMDHGGWFFEKTLRTVRQSTGTRTIHLYTRVDDDGNLQDRTIVKVTGFSSIERAEMGTNEEFETQIDLSRIQPETILACYGMSIRKRRHNNPKFLGYGYMEYAPYGDLCDLIRASRRTEAVDKAFPEYFIWLVFDSLLSTLITFGWGRAVKHDYMPDEAELAMTNDEYRLHRKRKSWYSLINTDIKPENVVLSHPTSRCPAIPMAKMIDFGMVFRASSAAHHTTMHDFSNMHHFGTPGYEPPEQATLKGDDFPMTYNTKVIADRYTVDVHSEIFNIGLIIQSLMSRTFKKWKDGTDPAPKIEKVYGNPIYSDKLYNAVNCCTRLDPDSRPDLPDLIAYTRKGLETARNLPDGDPVGVSMENIPDAFKLPTMINAKRPGDFMGDEYRIVKKRLTEDTSRSDEDQPDTSDEIPAKKRRTST